MFVIYLSNMLIHIGGASANSIQTDLICGPLDKQANCATALENQMFIEYRWLRNGLLTLSLLTGLYAPYAAAQPASKCAPDAIRDAWQRPAEVMDAMGATAGSVVADIGARSGYFTIHLAGRVGLQGKVYATDLVQEKHFLDRLGKCAKEEGLLQIEIIINTIDDPLLPEAALDAILLSKAYNSITQYDAMLQGMFRALKPGGKLVIFDAPPHKKYLNVSREQMYQRHEKPEEWVREEVTHNGFRFVHKLDDIIYRENEHWYFLVFEKPGLGASDLPAPGLSQESN
jgi:predicted methyltransferase